MIDKEKFEQVVKLLKESGAKTVVLLVNDGKYQSAHIDGMGIDILQCLYASMKKDDHFGILVGMALSSYLEEKEKEH